MTTTVVRNEERSRYELWRAGELIGIMDYVTRGAVTYLVHTEIAPGLRGRGQGDVLVGEALDDLAARGESFVGTCWFVEDFLARHARDADGRRRP